MLFKCWSLVKISALLVQYLNLGRPAFEKLASVYIGKDEYMKLDE
jgi:hypothetical protein